MSEAPAAASHSLIPEFDPASAAVSVLALEKQLQWLGSKSKNISEALQTASSPEERTALVRGLDATQDRIGRVVEVLETLHLSLLSGWESVIGSEHTPEGLKS